MKKIYNFKEFVNESYNVDEGILSDIGGKISQWAKQLMTAVKSGIIRMISSGPKKGLPAYVLFTPEKGSIVNQVEGFYKGTPYYEMNNLDNPATNEAVVPLNWGREEDVPDSNPDEIKNDIKRSLREVIRLADKIEASTDPSEKERLQSELKKVKPYFIYGAPGIGKTQIVARVCEELGQELYGQGLQLLNCDGLSAEPVDFAGVPKVVDLEDPTPENPLGKGVTRSNVNADILPYDNGKNQKGGILFIDEFNRMPVEVQKIFLLLAQQRRLGINYQMPTRWYIVAAGNRKEDDPKGGIVEMGTALQDRFEIVNLITNPEALRKYVETTPGLSDIFLPELLDFLDFDASWFHMNDPQAKKLKYPTPRAWEDASRAVRRLIQEYEGKGVSEVPHQELVREFQKNVGRDAAVAFLDFYKIAKEIPVRDLVLPFTDPDRAPVPADKGNKPDYTHALFAAVLRKSTEMKLTSKEMCNFAAWLKRVNSPEFGAMAIASIYEKHPYLGEDYESAQCMGPLADQWEVEIGTSF
jgi:hypothetical protein